LKVLHRFKALTKGKGAFDIVELRVTAGDTVAFATALLRCGSRKNWRRMTRRACA
jgi:ketosteroid isomerase-like protein